MKFILSNIKYSKYFRCNISSYFVFSASTKIVSNEATEELLQHRATHISGVLFLNDSVFLNSVLTNCLGNNPVTRS